ncbi:hypothetical protein QBC43DRAFT_90439 [Cladorrhinum sp. PSN259]|nr:hypothetical protein QBC43DRAFT_90439 [Cladorrhinum sp. PSN259]
MSNRRRRSRSSRHEQHRSDGLDCSFPSGCNNNWLVGVSEQALSTNTTSRRNDLVQASDALQIWYSEDRGDGFATGNIEPATQDAQTIAELHYPTSWHDIYPRDNGPDILIASETRRRNRSRNEGTQGANAAGGLPHADQHFDMSSYVLDSTFDSYRWIQGMAREEAMARGRHHSSHRSNTLAASGERRGDTNLIPEDEQADYTGDSIYQHTSDHNYSTILYQYPTSISEPDEVLIESVMGVNSAREDISEAPQPEPNLVVGTEEVGEPEKNEWVVVDKDAIPKEPNRRLWGWK